MQSGVHVPRSTPQFDGTMFTRGGEDSMGLPDSFALSKLARESCSLPKPAMRRHLGTAAFCFVLGHRAAINTRAAVFLIPVALESWPLIAGQMAENRYMPSKPLTVWLRA